jgi:hypothetical protein
MGRAVSPFTPTHHLCFRGMLQGELYVLFVYWLHKAKPKQADYWFVMLRHFMLFISVHMISAARQSQLMYNITLYLLTFVF